MRAAPSAFLSTCLLAIAALGSGCHEGARDERTPIAPEPHATAAVALTDAGPVASASAAPSASASAAPSAAPPAGDAAKYPVRWSSRVKLAGRDALDAALHEKLEPNGEPATLDTDAGSVQVSSCAAFLDAVDAGAQTGGSGFQAAQASFFDDRCTSLWFIHEAWPSRVSFVEGLRLDRKPLARLPAALAPYLGDLPSDFEAAIAKHASLAALTHLRVKASAKERVTIVDDEQKLESTIALLAWGDVDHDGIEDVLAMRSFFSTEGSFRAFTLYVLTQRSAAGPLEVARVIDG